VLLGLLVAVLAPSIEREAPVQSQPTAAEPTLEAEPDPPPEPEQAPPPAEPVAVEPVAVEPAPVEPTPSTPKPAGKPKPEATLPLRAPEPPMPPAKGRSWVVGAFVDAGYAFDSNFPDNHVNRGNGTAPRTGELTMPLGLGYLRHDPSEDEPWQLELALQVGPAATALVAYDPQPGGDTSHYAGVEVWQHLGRANAGGRIPGLRTEISAGLLGTPISIWSFWTKDNWMYSTPWHLNAVPYVLMAGRILQPVGERVVLHAWISNGYQTFADINKVPSYLLGAVAEPVDGLQVAYLLNFGPEDRDTSARAFRVLSDAWFRYLNPRWGLAGIVDVMRERLTLLPDEPVALYLTGALTPRVLLWRARDHRAQQWLVARGEAFWDRDGRMFGVRQLLGSAAIGTDVNLFGHLLLRLEYRYDRSTNPAGFFYRGGAIHDTDRGLGREQHAVYLMATGVFEHWFGRRDRP